MKLFVANGSKQNHDFIYVVTDGQGRARHRRQQIEVGGQIQISEDLTMDQIEAIVRQHAPYGFVPAHEVDRATSVVPLCFSTGDPVAAKYIHALMMRNAVILTQMGKQYRREAAIASNDILEKNLMESGRPEALRNLEVTMVEDNHDPRSPDPEFAEGISVQRGHETPTMSPRQRRRAEKRAGQ